MLQGFQNIILAIKDWANGKFQPSGNYALVQNAGYSLGLNIDSDYVMTIELKNASGNVLSTQNIDFPIESMVVNASYADGELTLTLQNGQELTVDISSIVNGLVNDTFTIAGIDMKDNITKEELASALGVPTKISDLENDSNFLTDTGDASATTVTFEQAAQRANVQSGDDLATAFAKLSKYCADLKNVAFTGEYSDLLNRLTLTNNLLATIPGTGLDATQGKLLNDKDVNLQNQINQINSDLGGFTIKAAAGEEVKDANDCTMGIYQANGSTSNAPFTFWHTIIATSFRGGWTQQIALPWDIGVRNIAYRINGGSNSTWQSWHYINFDS